MISQHVTAQGDVTATVFMEQSLCPCYPSVHLTTCPSSTTDHLSAHPSLLSVLHLSVNIDKTIASRYAASLKFHIQLFLIIKVEISVDQFTMMCICVKRWTVRVDPVLELTEPKSLLFPSVLQPQLINSCGKDDLRQLYCHRHVTDYECFTWEGWWFIDGCGPEDMIYFLFNFNDVLIYSIPQIQWHVMSRLDCAVDPSVSSTSTPILKGKDTTWLLVLGH